MQPQTASQTRYAAYLTTDHWKAVSDAVKARADYRCQVCNSPHDLEAHHRSYAHRGFELEHLDDLTCLCHRCHGLFHRKAPEAPMSPPATAATVVQFIRENGKGKKKKAINLPWKGETVIITEGNRRRIRLNKESWHWMKNEGINPRKSGWSERAIGRSLPSHFLW